MTRIPVILAAFLLSLYMAAAAGAAHPDEAPGLEVNPAAVERGREVFMTYCNACHALAYYRSAGFPDGVPAGMDAAAAKEAFGVEPPDLSLMAAARGKRAEGAAYIYRLLTGYHTGADGIVRNTAFAEHTETEGIIAMPEPIPPGDEALGRKAADVSVFLLEVADPSAKERKRLGYYVMGYMSLLTLVLYALNRYTWKGVKKKLDI